MLRKIEVENTVREEGPVRTVLRGVCVAPEEGWASGAIGGWARLRVLHAGYAGSKEATGPRMLSPCSAFRVRQSAGHANLRTTTQNGPPLA